MQGLSYLSTARLTPYRYSTVCDVIDGNLTVNPTREILIHRREDGRRFSITKEELDVKSTHLAKFLFQSGAQRGLSVAILGPNTIEWVIGELAILKTGSVSVHLSMDTIGNNEAITTLVRSKCKFVLVDPGISLEMRIPIRELTNKIAEWNRENPGSEMRVIALRGLADQEDLDCLEKILKINMNVSLPSIYPEDPAIVFATSGSTGKPKMIYYTHFNLVNLNDSVRGFDETDSPFFNDRPFCWVGGSPIIFLMSGRPRVFTDTYMSVNGLNPGYLWNVFKEEKCTTAMVLPFLIQDMCTFKENNKTDDDFLLQTMPVTGQIINDSYLKAVGLICKEMAIVYAATEGGHTIYNLKDKSSFRTGIVGKPTPGVEIKLINANGDTVQLGEQGEVCIRSRMTSQGIFNDRIKSEAMFIPGGWLRTGDIGVIDEDGNLVIVGRTKFVISRGTRKLIPGMIEDVIRNMKGLQEVVVIGVPDKRLAEEVCVCFSTESDSRDITVESVKTFCKDKFLKESSVDGLGESPTYFLKFDKMPRLITGKLDKKQLTEIAIQKLCLH